MRIRGLLPTVLGVLSAVLSMLVLWSASASAALTHNFVSSFGSFVNVQGVAVAEEAGSEPEHVYVYDTKQGAGSIYKFSASGSPEEFSALGTNAITNVGGGGPDEEEIAVDNSAGPAKGDIYVATSLHIGVYGSDGTKLGELKGSPAPGAPWGEPCGVAVDPAGNVYVGLASGNVNKYTPAGNLVANSDYTSSLWGLVGEVCNIAADSEGSVYADTWAKGPVMKYAALQFSPIDVTAEGTSVDSAGSTLAVEPGTNDVYVDQTNQVLQFDPTGASLGGFGASGAGSLVNGSSYGISVSGGTHQVYASAGSQINVFGPLVLLPKGTTGSATVTESGGVTFEGEVDPGGEPVTLCEFEYGKTTGYGQSIPCETNPGSGSSPVQVTATVPLLGPGEYHYQLVAGNANGQAGALDATFIMPGVPTIDGESVSSVSKQGATLEGQVNPDEFATTYSFRYATNEALTGAVVVPGAEPLEGFGDLPVSTTIAGTLEPTTTYYYQVVAENAKGTVEGTVKSFTTLPPSRIDSEASVGVGGTTATLKAQINPIGTDTTYHFEYGTSVAYGASVPVPDADIGSGESDTLASAHLHGLSQGTVYHYRVVATNTLGTVEGADRTFTTQATGVSLALPDNRAYEMVSPVDKNGGDAGVVFGEPPFESWDFSRSSVSGDKLVYSSFASFGPVRGRGFLSQYIATRGADGWSSQSINPPTEHNTPEELAIPYLPMEFTPELTKGVMTNFDPQLAAGAPPQYNDLYASDLTDPANPVYQALNTATPPNLLPGPGKLQPAFVAGSADLSHLVFAANDQLTPEAIPGALVNEGRERQDNLYESTDGHVHLVNISPAGTPMPGGLAGPGGTSLEGAVDQNNNVPLWEGFGIFFGKRGLLVEHTVSADGSRIFFTGPEDQLYVRENSAQPQSPIGGGGECTVPSDACTIEVSASQKTNGAGPGGTDPHGPKRAHYWDASSDGSVVYFTSCGQLTNDSTAVSSGRCERTDAVIVNGKEVGHGDLMEISGNDLYRFDTGTGQLTDLTVDAHAGDTLGADVQGVVGASEDGSYLYYVAHGNLAAGAASGQDNLYLYHAGTTRFIASLKKGSSGEGERRCFASCLGDTADWNQIPTKRPVRVSPDGTHLAFDSKARLTSYDNTIDGEGDCVLEDPESLARPEVTSDCTEVYLYDASTNHLVCASCNPTGERPLGRATLEPPMTSNYVPRNLSDDGSRLFFNTFDALVPGDVNGRQDVYEYTHGRAYLISGGTDTTSSYFLDASPSANDAFFLTRQQLVPGDPDQLFDVYDARVNGGIQQVSEPACVGTGCQGVPSAPPIFSTPSSVTFAGVGNFAPPATPAAQAKGCKRNAHGACVKKKTKKKQKRRHGKKSRKASRRGHGQRRGK